ncbi:MAG: hypothetical protein ACLRWQ_01915 [Flavonifractor plautii]
MLADYVTGGGKLLVMAGPTDERHPGEPLQPACPRLRRGRPTTASWWRRTGSTTPSRRPTFSCLIWQPVAITDPLIESSYYPILPALSGPDTVGRTPTGATVTALLTTSDASLQQDGWL